MAERSIAWGLAQGGAVPMIRPPANPAVPEAPMSATTVNPTLADRLWPAAGNRVLRAVLLALAGSLLLWASAKVQVPFYPVPMTLQTAVVLLIGVAYGLAPRGRRRCCSIWPRVPSGCRCSPARPERGIGLAYMVGPDRRLSGRLRRRRRHRRLGRRALAPLADHHLGLLAALAAIHLLGAAWLATLIGPAKAVSLGVLPFLLGDLVKVALVAAAAEAGLVRPRA